jgi:uncharacterized protein (TIGR00288 family)
MDAVRLPRVALFIDAENLVISTQKVGLPLNIKAIVDRAREEGTLSYARAYADWTQQPLLGYVSYFHDNVIELTQLSSNYGKNTADIQIVVDAIEMALNEGAPDIFALVGGDRDFVPVVQKLKRYGKRVVGIGLKETTSPALHNVCDAFLFYNNLLPDGAGKPGSGAPAQAAIGEPVPVELRGAFEVLLRAVIALERKSDVPTGANVRPLMQQLDPSFDLSRFPFVKFAEFVEAAVKAGYVKFGLQRGEHFTLQSPPPESRPLISQPISLLSKGVFDNDGEALQAYREVLAQKRVPLIPWRDRQILIRHLWDVLSQHPEGLVPYEMHEVLINGAGMHFMNLPKETLYKLMFTLSLGECFERNGQVARLDPTYSDPVRPRCGYEEALMRANTTYIRGIRFDRPEMALRQRALALLLFDKDGDEEIRAVDGILGVMGVYAR